jgi:hypothetical protein
VSGVAPKKTWRFLAVVMMLEEVTFRGDEIISDVQYRRRR